jgi:hypothetical protein
MEEGLIMSISRYFQVEMHPFSFHLPKVADFLPRFGAGRSRRSRIDQGYLPESLQRDLGLIDGRCARGGSGHGYKEAWSSDGLMHPPRSL